MARPRRRQNGTPARGQNGNANTPGTATGNTSNGTESTTAPQPATTAPPVRRHISGPQSALTDYLASHNISARQIRDTADQRRREAAEQARRDGVVPEEDPMELDDGGVGSSRTEQPPKTKAEAKKLEKIKASKAFQKRKREAGSDDDEDDIARALFQERMAPAPGQMENCEICGKRFTVTPYSVAGPEGGLCCATCGREIAKKREGDRPRKKAAPKKQTGGVGTRRAVQSRILDGDVGVKSLSTLSVEKLAKHVEMAESLGDLPDHLIDKVARIISKRRLLKPETLPLFTGSTSEVLHIYDGARLGEAEFIQIFLSCPNLKRFKVRCAIQFKDEVMDFMMSRSLPLESFYLAGANLLSEEKWHEFLRAQGANLKELVIKHTDIHVGDDTMRQIRDSCPSLKRLKIANNQKVTSEGVKVAGELPGLEKLGFDLRQNISPDALAGAIAGENRLTTLSFRDVPGSDDSLVEAIHNRCRFLNKLRITDSEHITDKGFAKLFTNWENPALEYVDLRKCRQIDHLSHRDNPDRIGLCDDGFKALMAHSGHRLRHLNIQSDRHISREAFEDVFGKDEVYPELAELEISFCEDVTDFVLGSIFRSCPKMRKVVVFGCMKLKQVRVPRGCALVGLCNAEGMITEG